MAKLDKSIQTMKVGELLGIRDLDGKGLELTRFHFVGSKFEETNSFIFRELGTRGLLVDRRRSNGHVRSINLLDGK